MLSPDPRLVLDTAEAVLRDARRLLHQVGETWAVTDVDHALSHLQRAIGDLGRRE